MGGVKRNLIELTKNCLCCITHPYSSAGFDAMMNSSPVLQLWPIKIDSFSEKQKLLKSNLFIKEKSSFEKLNLILTSKSPKDFSKKIRLIIKEKNNKKSKFENKKILSSTKKYN